MSTPQYILDEPLPLSQDFRSLRAEGLDRIKQYIGNNWTNFNASDPGVTILDQVCFALTELGYCNDFSIEDIITESDGKIHFSDQFYLPEDILTVSPVTPQDYIKYIVDGIKDVQNAIIVPANNQSPSAIDQYQVYLLIDNTITDPANIDNICLVTFFYLNSARNLGETFAMPQYLKPVTHFITGIITITDQTQLSTILSAIDQNIRNYIFPAAVHSGYQQLIESGLDINQVFNGPLLQHGWVPSDHLGQKINQLKIIDLFELIGSVPGIESVSGFTFDNGPLNQVVSDIDELLVVDLKQSVQQGLKFYYKGSGISKELLDAAFDQTITPAKPEGNIYLGVAQKVQTSILTDKYGDINNFYSIQNSYSEDLSLGANADNAGASYLQKVLKKVQTTVPVGKYRDINNYYSIHNTFPEAFAVGANTDNPNTTPFQVAQSRQLKGYLTLFDQVLANQFSQLANINQLFSFRNSLTGTPSDEHEYYAIKDDYGRKHPEYPAPYLYFAPTYFYQSLYDVPDIRPLLKNSDTLKFNPGPESEKELEHKSWLRFKEDPYNSYIWGLKEFMEEGNDNLHRRETMLDHLLARHGESAVMINTIIDGPGYTGDLRKDRIILKSLYLQNLGLLSYYRQKGCNYLAAGRILSKVMAIPTFCLQYIMREFATDFVFDSARIDLVEKLEKEDFENYSALECKLSLLLALKVQYRNYIADNYDAEANTQNINVNLAYWMIRRRKGVIFIESALLLPYLNFEVVIAGNTQSGPYWQIDGVLSYLQTSAIVQALSSSQTTLAIRLPNITLSFGSTNYLLVPARPAITTNLWYKPIAGTNYYFTVRLKNGNEIKDPQNTPLLNSKAVVVFPSFIPQFNTPAFKSRLNFFMQNTLPVQLGFDALFADGVSLEALIAEYCKWHNGLLSRDKSKTQPPAQPTIVAPLALIINEIFNTQK